MVQKQTKSKKSISYIGMAFKVRISENILSNWQQKYNKWVGSPKGNKLMDRVAGYVQNSMKKIDVDYICSGSEYESDYGELLVAIRSDIEEAPPE